MGETLSAPYAVIGSQVTVDATMSVRSHEVSYATGLMEGVPLAVSSDNAHLCAMEPHSHAARHILGAYFFDPAVEAARLKLGDAWQLPITITDAYELAREKPADFQLEARILAKGGISSLTLTEYVRLLKLGLLANLESVDSIVPNYCRPIIARGAHHWDMRPGGVGVASFQHAWDFFITYWQWPKEYMGDGVFTQGAKVMIHPDFILHDSLSAMSNIKAVFNYGGFRTVVKNVATQWGFKDAIILGKTMDGRTIVTEMTGANLFAVFGDVLVTPKLSRLILPGTTRDNVLTLARLLQDRLGLSTIEERDMSLQEFLAAKEIFAVGSAAKVTPITEIHVFNPKNGKFVGHRVGDGVPGPLTCALQAAYFYIERGEPFAMQSKDAVTVVDKFEPRVTRLQLSPSTAEKVVSQLGATEDQKFDKRFRIARPTETAFLERRGRRDLALR